jgi:DNA/RNA-binding domain of Phe-tRNA-synthetase-like protein
VHFHHADEIWKTYSELAAGVLRAGGIGAAADVQSSVERFEAIAQARLAGRTESELPEIQAWRRTFARMGLKPTQYRCAAESLLRRYRKEGPLPRIHPLVDLCNAASLAFAIPIAVFDLAQVEQSLEVRLATGAETYLNFGGEPERPELGEVIFADQAGRAHARRWTHRQSGLSAVRGETAGVLIVAEALHEAAAEDVGKLVAALAAALAQHWPGAPKTAVLSAAAPRFAC